MKHGAASRRNAVFKRRLMGPERSNENELGRWNGHQVGDFVVRNERKREKREMLPREWVCSCGGCGESRDCGNQ